MLNGQPCPLPDWPAEWSLLNSTVMMASGPAAFAPKHHWGMASLDWGVNVNTWIKDGAAHSTCEATSTASCLALKTAGKLTRCSIYHNMELALEWLESNRAVMDAQHIEQGYVKQGVVHRTGLHCRTLFLDLHLCHNHHHQLLLLLLPLLLLPSLLQFERNQE